MKNALVVIDIQNDYFSNGSYPLEAAEAACKGAVKAIEEARKDGWLIVGVQHIATTDAPFFHPGTEGAQIHPEVAEALKDAPILSKTEADSFFKTDLEQLLNEHQITDVYLTGMMTQQCITYTALSPQAKNMNMHIIAKGCAAPTKPISDLALLGLSVRCDVI